MSEASEAADTAAAGKVAGFSVLDLLDLPDAERVVARWLVRRGDAEARTLAEQTGLGESVVAEALRSLAARGYVETVSEAGGGTETPYWHARLVSRRARRNAPGSP